MNAIAAVLLCLAPIADEPDSAALVEQAREALDRKAPKEALALIGKAIEANPKAADLHVFRGTIHDQLGQHANAVISYTRALELEPNNIEVLDLRGSANFKAGRVKESADDFDRYVKLRPKEFNGHWRRGISLYYAGKFDEGRKQFEGYEAVDTNDVENAVWHFLCAARKDGVEKARKSILKIGRDKRVPMMAVYDLFQGKATPEDVLKVCKEGDPDERETNYRLFYAHLYLGLYAEVKGDAKLALKHLTESAEKRKVHPYMWDVARVHRDLLKAKQDQK